MATTPTYAFNLPTVGGDINTWGALLNSNWTALDNRLDGTTALTGTKINAGVFNGTIGATVPAAADFTTVDTTDDITITKATGDATLTVKNVGTGDADAILVLDNADTGESKLKFSRAATEHASITSFLAGLTLNIKTAALTDMDIALQPNDAAALTALASGDVQIHQQLLAANGSAAAPSYSFVNDTDSGTFRVAANVLGWATNGLERGRVSSGNLLWGKTATDISVTGAVLKASGQIAATTDGLNPLEVNRLSTSGSFIKMNQGGNERGVIGSDGNDLYIDSDSTGTGIELVGGAWLPRDAGALVASTVNLASSTYPMDDIYHTGSIGSSDENMKHDIEALTPEQMELGKLLAEEFVTFKWNHHRDNPKREAKTISGVIAQRVAAAFEKAGLDWREYGVVTRGTWLEAEVHYPEIKAVAEVEGQCGTCDVPAVKEVKAVVGKPAVKGIPLIRKVQEAVVEVKGVRGRLAVEGRPHITPVTAVEGRAAFSRIETWDARSKTNPPANAVEKERWGVDKDQLWVFVMRYQSQLSKDMEARITLLEGNK